jgi:hypothetical protein
MRNAACEVVVFHLEQAATKQIGLPDRQKRHKK